MGIEDTAGSQGLYRDCVVELPHALRARAVGLTIFKTPTSASPSRSNGRSWVSRSRCTLVRLADQPLPGSYDTFIHMFLFVQGFGGVRGDTDPYRLG